MLTVPRVASPPGLNVHDLDAVIVGAGGAGLYAALELKKDLGPTARVAVVSKLYPSRSHTGAAQGGVCAALGNTEEDHWEWHWFDTVKGGDYLVDQDAAEVMCRDAIETIINLEHLGMPFDRTPEGLIDQRRFGGHSRNYGEAPVRRSCYAADRTGHAILHTLYQQCIRHDVTFYDEFQVLDLLMPNGSDGAVTGVLALELATSEIHTFRARAVLFATGGFGKMFKVTTNAHTLTGDGVAIPYRRGLPLEDMEFYQFHPTGMYRLGFLLSEAMRGEGGFLVNDRGERFMERYAPTMKDLASRDVVSRSIYLEIAEGRGIGGKDYVYLDVRHLGDEVLNKKLPDMTGFIKTYFGLDPLHDLVPIQPTAHYAMGGIPTDIDGRVLGAVTDGRQAVVPGFYAAGECACVSVHGANRLGTNSLLDLLVFGRRAGMSMAQDLRGSLVSEAGASDSVAERTTGERVRALLSSAGGERPAAIRTELQELMFTKCGVFRTEQLLTEARDGIAALKERAGHLHVEDKGCRYNTDLGEALEVGFLLDCADAAVASALARTESRGAHAREDFPDRNDTEWLRHSLAFADPAGGQPRLDYKPVVVTRFEPKARVY
ncbi:MAG TPA: succinate dehydrogenase flavoprotein subunit [Candidatus Limnocylindria bacterium]|nr:succinate dehydrogenase flavoprotein subunit [Candidatus Limnocylindria bacterium]